MMDYFPNGDFTKSYPLPGISYYMSNIAASVPSGQAQQGILGLTTSTYDGQPFADGTDFSSFQQQFAQQQQQPTAVTTTRRQQQYLIGQKRRSAYQHHHYQQQQTPNAPGEHMNKEGRKVDPFAPECSIPLPYQLGDEYSYYGPTAVWKRNERERHRVRCVNDGYEKLRNHLPVPDKYHSPFLLLILMEVSHKLHEFLSDKRLSKVETLRFAIRYIQHLEKLLADSRHDEQCDCDFTIRSSSVSDSCQSPAVTTTDQQQQKRHGKSGKTARRYRRRASSDETSDENEDNSRN